MFGRIFRFLVFIQRFWHSEIAEGMKNRKKKKYNTKLHEFRVAHGSCRFIHKLRVDCITIHALVLCFLHFCHRKGRQVYWERERERAHCVLWLHTNGDITRLDLNVPSAARHEICMRHVANGCWLLQSPYSITNLLFWQNFLQLLFISPIRDTSKKKSVSRIF